MVMRHALARRPLKINASCHGLMRPGQPRHAGGISSSSPTLYCESNCDLYSVRGREAHRNTGPAPRLCFAGNTNKAVRSVTSVHNIPTNGLNVPASKRSELTHVTRRLPEPFYAFKSLSSARERACVATVVLGTMWRVGNGFS